MGFIPSAVCRIHGPAPNRELPIPGAPSASRRIHQWSGLGTHLAESATGPVPTRRTIARCKDLRTFSPTGEPLGRFVCLVRGLRPGGDHSHLIRRLSYSPCIQCGALGCSARNVLIALAKLLPFNGNVLPVLSKCHQPGNRMWQPLATNVRRSWRAVR